MCKMKIIGPVMLVIGILYILVSSLLFLISLNLAWNDEATIAFDSANVGSAVWLILVAILMCPLSITGAIGAREHNKFCLCSFCGLTLILLFTMWGVAGTLERLSYFPITDEEALVCLTSGLVSGTNGTTEIKVVLPPAVVLPPTAQPKNNGTSVTYDPYYERYPSTFDEKDEEILHPCKSFFADEYITRLRNLWVILHDRAQDQLQEDSKKWNTFMVKLQKGQIAAYPCCGFSRPAHCTGLTGEECSNKDQDEKTHTYYQSTQVCSQGNGGCVSL